MHLLYLEDMLLAMNRIAEYIAGLHFHGFKQDYKTVDAVIRNFEIIGEVSKKIPDFIKKKYPDVPWAEMYLLRNKVSIPLHSKRPFWCVSEIVVALLILLVIWWV